MPIYHYKAVAPGGITEEGQMEGASEAYVIQALQAAGYLPIRAHCNAQRTHWSALLSRSRRKPLGPHRLAAFTHDLALLLRSGLPLDQALHLLGGQAKDPRECRLIETIEDRLRNGCSLSAALAEEHSQTFPSVYVALVRAGEAGGALEPALTRLHEYLEHNLALRRSVRSAMIYPALLLTIALLSVLILLIFVIPQFGQLFADSGQPLPASTRVVLGTSELLRAYWWLGLGAIAATVAILRRLIARPEYRKQIDRKLLSLPVLGDLIRRIEVARFTRTLGTLLQNGVPLLSGVNIAAAVFSNHVLQAAVPDIIESLTQGHGMAAPLQHSGQFPQLTAQLIGIGEESGQLDSMLLRCADMLDTEIRQRIQSLITLLEPALIVVLGLVIAGILMSILTAILAMNDIAL